MGTQYSALSSEKHVKTCIYASLHVMPDNAEYWPIHLRAFRCQYIKIKKERTNDEKRLDM